MADGQVQIAPEGTGKIVDTSELTRSDGTTLVERQRVNISDPDNLNGHMEVAGEGGRGEAQVASRSVVEAIDDATKVLVEIRDLLTEFICS